VGIVGAGPSGLAALRALRRSGLEAVAFEKGGRIGGVWTREDRSTAAYRTLHLITSRERTEYGEMAMPPETADYPPRDAVGAYLEDYAERFGLHEHVRLNSEVVSTERLPGGGWRVEVADGSSEEFDYLVVANGHNEEPTWPSPPYPGSDEFGGRQLHALEYDEPSPFAGQRVMVVGMGNSAMDIVTDMSHVAERTILSVRHGSWVIPKRLLGKPADQVVKPFMAVHVPWQIRQPVSQTLLRVVTGPPERYGLPEPDGGLFQSHPTITDTVLSRISHGRIHPKPGIESFSPGGVTFVDGSSEELDAVVWCTGYRVTIPFLDESYVGPDPKELRLYMRVFHPRTPDLFFVGLMQSTGSAFPIVERQSEMLADYLTGRWAPPSPRAMRAAVERRYQRAMKRWGPGGRPAMRVDFDRFMYDLGRELDRGRKRAARKNGGGGR
jgi:cation diffusion facilitator CzcD-associated flavoprotein CzcO